MKDVSEANNKEKLLIAAREEFAANGYKAASVNRIIAETGLSKGTFYHYFADKRALYGELIEAYGEKKRAAYARTEGVSAAPREGESIFEWMKAQSAVTLQFAQDAPEWFAFGKRAAAETHETAAAALGASAESSQSFVEAWIEMGAAHGDFSARYDQAFISPLLAYMMQHFYCMLRLGQPGLSAEDIKHRLDMFFDFLKNGLGNKEERDG